ncbi:MAG: efflux RND transporter periplasmic adaptor subunit [Melioribacteraceae bacterium]|nr:efflux RND transporter periplasmic adaptor subunit [Melioribacteraceae bacterium]
MKTFNLTVIILVTIVIFSCNDDVSIENKEYSGTIENSEVIISSHAMGRVEKVFIKEGANVKKGDTLAIIDYEKLLLQLKQAVATKNGVLAEQKILTRGARKEDRALAKEALTQAEANYKLAKSSKERMEKLIKTDAITQKQFDDALAAYDVAFSKYNQAKQNLLKSKSARPEQIELLEANLLKAEVGIELIQKSINDCYIIAPINGQIVNQFIEESETVTFLTSLFKIINLEKSYLTIYVSEIDLAFVKLGAETEISIDAFNDKTFVGNISFISPEAEFTPKNIQTKDERTKLVFAVKIDINNPEKILKPGMPADAVIRLDD